MPNIGTLDSVSKARTLLTEGDVLYLGDMAARKRKYRIKPHTCTKVKRPLGSYINLDGSPAYIEVYECLCCARGRHEFLPAILGRTGDFVGFVCMWCGVLDTTDNYNDKYFMYARNVNEPRD